jgi:biopolymer transport protein ExbD
MALKLSAEDEGAGVVGEINVVPLIDVLFSILTFFVLASIFLTQQKGLPLDLPKAAPPVPNAPPPSQLTLVINKSGKYLLDKKPIELKNIGPTVKAALDANENAILIIAGEKDAQYAAVVDVLDELRQLNISRIGMATDAES